jgi:hypothetical protein
MKYPKELEEYVREIAPGRLTSEISQMVEEKFSIKFSINSVRAFKKRHKITSGVDCRFHKGNIPANKGKPMPPEIYEKCKVSMFKKGNIPHNKMNVGDRTRTSDGYLIEKVSDTGTQRERFEFVHRMEWVKHYGPIPEGKKVSFLDGNKENCSIENLFLIDNDEHLEMIRRKLRFEDAELTAVGANIAKLNIATRRRKNGKDNQG